MTKESKRKKILQQRMNQKWNETKKQFLTFFKTNSNNNNSKSNNKNNGNNNIKNTKHNYSKVNNIDNMTNNSECYEICLKSPQKNKWRVIIIIKETFELKRK